MEVKPIGIIHSPFTEAIGTPIQSSLARAAVGTVDVFPQFAEGLKDLDGFERIWLLYWFHRASQPLVTVIPYLNNTKRGLFATRAPCRPNPIGLSCVKLTAVEECKLHIEDVDILDETPLLDIKPYAPKFDHFQVKDSGWLDRISDERKNADGRFYENNRRGSEG
jgi:tRNA-Thr(GGU) m(6)t(6)A37 methyltransferase TsaA